MYCFCKLASSGCKTGCCRVPDVFELVAYYLCDMVIKSNLHTEVVLLTLQLSCGCLQKICGNAQLSIDAHTVLYAVLHTGCFKGAMGRKSCNNNRTATGAV